MTGKPVDPGDPAYRRMWALYNSIPPGPDRGELFLEKVHGPGWKERAMRAGPLTLRLLRRVRELEERVARIERRLNQPVRLLEWDDVGPIEPAKTPRLDE